MIFKKKENEQENNKENLTNNQYKIDSNYSLANEESDEDNQNKINKHPIEKDKDNFVISLSVGIPFPC